MRERILALGLVFALTTLAGALPAAAQSPPGAAAGLADPDVLLAQLEAVLEDLLAPAPYDYLSAGRRDPFIPLIQPGSGQARHDLPGVDDLIIVGVLWADTEYIALAETRDGRSLTLRPGDAIRNGEVLEVGESSVLVRHSHYGVTRRVTLTIASGEEEQDER